MELENVKKAVCLIQSTAEGNRVLYEGTGFHFGSGWIMTVAHNFQDDDETDETFHNIMAKGKFKVTWNGHEFEEHKRMAFVHHLQPGDDADTQNKDIAMFKLGIQYEYGRNQNDYSDWENSEDEMLRSMNAASCAIANAQGAQLFHPQNPQVRENVYAFYYGGADDAFKEEELKITKITQGSDTVPLLVLEKSKEVLPHGSSGCPVMIKRDGKYYLAGLHFAGDDDEESGEALALPWNKDIKDYINEGVGIIADIGRYQLGDTNEEAAKKSNELKSDLELKAKNAKLTIYLCNGDVLK